VLHPQQEADFLADRTLNPGPVDEGMDHLELADLQAVLRQLFAAEACSYFVVGAVAQDATWLEKTGFGPVAVVN
jgi:hypothetical protein